MSHTCNFDEQRAYQSSGSVIEDLLAEGVDRSDIDLALFHQRAQRKAGVPVLSLRAILGREQVDNPTPIDWSASNAIASTPRPKRITGGKHITHRPVLAGSVQTGTPHEIDFQKPMHKSERKRISDVCFKTWKRGRILASEARRGVRALTEDETKLTAFTASCRDILLRLLDEAEFRKGWCVPSYEAIMRWTGLSRSTVHRSLKVLANLGFIEWIRRFIYEKDAYLGARSSQTSNLYRFNIPRWLAKLLHLHAPVPDDHQHRQEAAIEEHALMLGELPLKERVRMLPTSPENRQQIHLAALRSEWRTAQECLSRECQNETPPHPIIY